MREVPVDLRSDTVTRPTPAMRRAMADAEVGDDQYGEDPTVNSLQERFAELVGKEAALFLPSGTMANQVALRCLTRPGDAVVTGARQHVVLYELGAGPLNAGITWLGVPDDLGWFGAAALESALDAAEHHQPRPAAVFVEDTHMAAGGAVWPEGRLDALAGVAASRGLPLHLDGARLWHAAVAAGQSLAERAAPATTTMCSLSKGLAAPVGSLLAGPAGLIESARLERQRLGGAMRQAGVLAAAGLVAIGTMVERLAEDHRRASRLAEAVEARWPGSGPGQGSAETNIVLFEHPDPAGLLRYLEGEAVLAGTIAPGVVRLVTHVDVDDEGVERACRALRSAPV